MTSKDLRNVAPWVIEILSWDSCNPEIAKEETLRGRGPKNYR